jgi:hypothetical protein
VTTDTGPCSSMPMIHYIITAVFQGVNLLLTTWLMRNVARNGHGQAPRLPRRRGPSGP